MFPWQGSQDPVEQQQQQTEASSEQPAEKKINKKRARFTGLKPERKYRCATASLPVRKRARHTPAVSHRRPSMDLLEQSPQVLLRRVFFLNREKSKYVSVGFYPARFYYAFIEFCGANLLPVIINEQHLTTLSEHLPKLCEAMFRCGRYNFRDGEFRLLYSGGYRAVARMCFDKRYITFLTRVFDVCNEHDDYCAGASEYLYEYTRRC
jgi:hypothetical protein